MLRLALAAATSIAALTITPLPMVASSAFAQRCHRGATCGDYPKPSTYSCSSELGYLRRVYEEELDAVSDPHYVSVVAVCQGEDYGALRSEGNAGALRQAIADNDAMTEALFVKGDFRPEDVVGIRMTGEEKVILYVHPFRR